MDREKWIDWMRVAACLMVMVVHSTEPFYLGGEGSRILTEGDAYWASFFDTFVRAKGKDVPAYTGSDVQWNWHNSKYGFQDKNALLPIPLKELELNPNMKQNPGW